MMTIEEMHRELWKYCYGFNLCGNSCRLCKPDGSCRWNELNDESTEDCYHFLIAEGLIGKPEQPEINFVKVERNDEVERMTYEEAISTLRDFLNCIVPEPENIKTTLGYKRFEAFNKAIEALEWLQQPVEVSE